MGSTMVIDMGVRAFLREMRDQFETQEEMAEWMSGKAGKIVPQPTLSLWLSGERHPDKKSRRMIRRAFRVPGLQWSRILLDDDEDTHEQPKKGRPAAVA